MKTVSTSLLFVLFVACGFVSGLEAAQIGAESPISLQAGRPPDNAWPVVEAELRRLPTKVDDLVSDLLEDELYSMIDRGEAKTRKEAFALLLRYDIAWGYVDLEGDGIDEMLVWLGLPVMCGSAGCQTLILHRNGDGWTKTFFMFLGEPVRSLCYTREGPDGFPMIRSDTTAFWWSGTTLRSICYQYCIGFGDRDAIDEDELANATPQELSVRALLRDQPWCAATSPN